MKRYWQDLLVFIGNVQKYATPSRWDVQGDSVHFDCAFCHQEWWWEKDNRRPVPCCCPDARRFALCDLSDEQLAKPPAPTVVEEAEKHGIEVLTDRDDWFTVIRSR